MLPRKDARGRQSGEPARAGAEAGCAQIREGKRDYNAGFRVCRQHPGPGVRAEKPDQTPAKGVGWSGRGRRALPFFGRDRSIGIGHDRCGCDPPDRRAERTPAPPRGIPS